jgi:hypothetical protein
MPHDGVGSNLSLLDKKMKISSGTEPLDPRRLNEQPSHAHILDAGQIAVAIALPIDPHTIARLDARVEPSGTVGTLQGHSFTLDLFYTKDPEGPGRKSGRRNIANWTAGSKFNRRWSNFDGSSTFTARQPEAISTIGSIDAVERDAWAYHLTQTGNINGEFP